MVTAGPLLALFLVLRWETTSSFPFSVPCVSHLPGVWTPRTPGAPGRPCGWAVSVSGLGLQELGAQAGKPDVRFRTFTTLGDLLWYYFLLLGLWFPYLAGMGFYFIVIVPLLPPCFSFSFLDMGYFLWWVPGKSC